MWKIEYSKEVRNYIYDSYPYTADVWQTIKMLRTTPDGLPTDLYDEIETEPSTIKWVTLDHLIIYERYPAQQLLYFFVLKPANGD